MKRRASILTTHVILTFIPISPAQSPSLKGSAAHDTEPQAAELKLTNVKSRADGSLELQVNSTQQFKVLIESSVDLSNWSGEALSEPNTVAVLAHHDGPGAHRFYRATPFTLRVQGIVRDIQTEIPIAGAKVTLSDLAWQTADIITSTDAQGFFTAVVSREFPLHEIKLEKAGYDVLTTYPYVDSTIPNFQVPLWLAPPGYRPPNDDFQNRFNIEGTTVTVQARTFAATSEPGHDLYIFFGDAGVWYPRDLWYTWTAPKNGAAIIRSDFHSAVAIYTGQSLTELISIWDTANSDNSFFVKQGIQYQISFGTISPADTAFTLKMVNPLPPVRIRAWVGDALTAGSPIRAVSEALYLTAAADGTSPLFYQWRKDGLDIPNATNLFFSRRDISLDDAGAYSVRVTNEAGTAISENIQITVLSERPQRPELLQGTWIQETSQGPLLITFADLNFTSKWVSNNSPAGSGHFRFSESDSPDAYRLVMTYTNQLPEVIQYSWVWLTSPNAGSYHETGSSWYPTVDYDSGSFTRSPQP